MTSVPPIPEPIAEEKRGRGWLAGLSIVLLLLFGALAVWLVRSDDRTVVANGAVSAVALDPDGMAPEGQRVRVRVINTTKVRGLARRATNLVRDLGFDVVEYASESTEMSKTTVVPHTGHHDWAIRLARGVGADSIAADTVSSHYVDLTLLIGSDWKPPAQPFRP